MNADVEPGFALLNAAIPMNSGAFAIVSAEHAACVLLSPWREQNGYAARMAKRADGKWRTLLLHRYVAALAGMPVEGIQIDHINGDRLDNRLSNLRAACNAENARNQTKKQAGCTSRFKGVSAARGGRWQAHIRANGVNVYLGQYRTELEAQDAYAAAAVKYFGEFAAPRVERKP